ncbi:GGDEF domain-containing response regulator [Sulfurimonas marina]|uniref:diguanylate cyclase n=1 Tax=Sulfurimonas marina TaxID=2590551 RepID=A0A7M1AUQ4_9BACT|nr:diguanylate cyclase [Sulfurimonas marina]QOP41149.1 diguanylate cyclase [Sulfurimonas marina]
MDNKPIVLVVDDEQTNVDIVSNILTDKYDLRVAHNGTKALMAIEKFNIELILLDIQMPGINGFEVAKQIREQKKYDHIPIIFLTSQKNEDSIVEGFDIGGNDYITKPFNPKELIARVQTHLHVHQLQKFLEMMLNMQSTIIVLSDGADLTFINQTGLDFFDFEDSDQFFKYFTCICDAFVNIKGCFYPNPDDQSGEWIEKIQKLPQDKRNVAIRSKDSKITIFHVSVQSIPASTMYIIDFNDITESIEKQRLLEEQVIHDPLTGAYNRTYFHQNVDRFTKNNRYNDELKVVAFFDIDYFKQVNDTYGHDVGDIILQEFVEVIQNSIRDTDTLIRWGGEEFILIVSLQERAFVEKILEKLRSAIEQYNFTTIGNITCSIGATFFQTNEDIYDTIKRADIALYQSKSDGRNRITLL